MHQHWRGNLCRHEPTPVFELEGITYCGGSDSKVYPRAWTGLVVNLTGQQSLFSTPKMINTSKNWKNLETLGSQLPPIEDLIVITWPDYGTPSIDNGFWGELHASCKIKGITEVLLYCIGGHGRTGTALSSILIANADYKPIEAIQFVRKNLCDECVESYSQIQYLFKLAGMDIPGYKAIEQYIPDKTVKWGGYGKGTGNNWKGNSQSKKKKKKTTDNSGEDSAYLAYLRRKWKQGWDEDD